jgi:glycosyltransferase involved in cell wall biosynthesis
VTGLRIAQVAPIARPVSEATAASIEQIVWLLTEELVRRGHDVTLFATGESQTSARLHAIYERGYDDDPNLWAWDFHELLHVASAFERAEEFDVIHTHTYHFGLPFTRLVETPVVHTYHVLPDDDVVAAYARYPEAQLVSISAFQRSQLDGIANRTPVIHHGIDFGRFPFNDKRGDYLAFVGELRWGKGPVEAIELARKAGMRIVLAGPHDGDGYSRDHVRPRLAEAHVEYVGPVGADARNALLADAAALVYPLNLAETFGLVMVESMACGTPVLALDRGAVREIVDNGVTGFCAPDVDALAEVVPHALELDRAVVRRHASGRFGHHRMVDEYERLYASIVGRHTAARTA